MLAALVGAILLSMALASKEQAGMDDQQSTGSLTREDTGAALLQEVFEFISQLNSEAGSALLPEANLAGQQQMCSRETLSVFKTLESIIGVVISAIQNWMTQAMMMGGGSSDSMGGFKAGGFIPGRPGRNPGGFSQGGYQSKSLYSSSYSSKAERRGYASIWKLGQLKKKVVNMKQKCSENI